MELRLARQKGWAEVILLCLSGLGVLPSLLSTGSGQGVTSLTCPAATRPGPPTSRRHYGVGLRHPAVEATIHVTEPPPYRRALGLSRSPDLNPSDISPNLKHGACCSPDRIHQTSETHGGRGRREPGPTTSSLRPRPPSRDRSRAVVPLWFRRSRRGSSGRTWRAAQGTYRTGI